MPTPTLEELANLVRRHDRAMDDLAAAAAAMAAARRAHGSAAEAAEVAKAELENAYALLANSKAGVPATDAGPRDRFMRYMREAGIGVPVGVEPLAMAVYGSADAQAKNKTRSLAHALKEAKEIVFDPANPGTYMLSIGQSSLSIPAHASHVDPDDIP